MFTTWGLPVLLLANHMVIAMEGIGTISVLLCYILLCLKSEKKSHFNLSLQIWFHVLIPRKWITTYLVVSALEDLKSSVFSVKHSGLIIVF